MIAGICARSIDADVIVIGIMSSEMPIRLDALAVLRQRLDGPFLVELRRRHAAADVVAAECGHRLQDGVRIAVLRPDLELHVRRRCGWFCRSGRRSRDLRGDERFSKCAGGYPAASKPNEFAAIHD